MKITRRQFAYGIAASATLNTNAQTSEWGGPVVDCHYHPRRTLEANTAHMDGAGISNAMLLARAGYAEQFSELRAKYPGRYLGWFAGTDVTSPDASKILEEAVKKGAIGFGELKSHVEAAGPELRRLYALAAELGVPILVHFQEVPHTPTEGTFATGFKTFEAMLKAYPKTTFIGHADAFWANVSADYANQEAYPAGKIARGGVTDKLLGDYANLYGDLAANSGNNALSRDPQFTPDFLKRHQDKLIFGSDCSCADGKGGGVSQANNPGASRLAGKCVARETLTLLKKTATPQMFRKLTWDNAHRVYKLKSS
ncbi:MAG TPA: amidohydrolase family protein [Bryobacteraceae bacterium]|nr:amidohydrolase family protein [Bryobacteraceae bacterium]